MRLLPVSNAAGDFAEVSPLIQVEAKKTKGNSSARPFSFSFLVWLAVSLAIPIVTYQVSTLTSYN